MDNESPTFLDGLSKLWESVKRTVVNLWDSWFPRPEEYKYYIPECLGPRSVKAYRGTIYRQLEMAQHPSFSSEDEQRMVKNLAEGIAMAEAFGVTGRATLLRDIPEQYRARVASEIDNQRASAQQTKEKFEELESQPHHGLTDIPARQSSRTR
jgi:hypothetical protein